jgi:hypothetical protein
MYQMGYCPSLARYDRYREATDQRKVQPMSQPTPAKPARRGWRDLGTVVLTLAIIAGFGYWILSACGQI